MHPPFGGTEQMFKVICLTGLLVIGASSVCAAIGAGLVTDSATSLLLGSGLLVVGLFGRRKRLSDR
jgi:hypothetical protein